MTIRPDRPGGGMEPLLAALGGDKPALVHLTAPWCVFDALSLPVFGRLERRLGSRATCLRVVVDGPSPLTERLRVRCLPALVLAARGRVLRRWYGGELPEAAVLRAFERAAAEA